MISGVIGRKVPVLEMMKAVFNLAAALLIIENGFRRGALEAGKDDFLTEGGLLRRHLGPFALHAEHIAPAVVPYFELVIAKRPRSADGMSFQIGAHLRLNLLCRLSGNGFKEGFGFFHGAGHLKLEDSFLTLSRGRVVGKHYRSFFAENLLAGTVRLELAEALRVAVKWDAEQVRVVARGKSANKINGDALSFKDAKIVHGIVALVKNHDQAFRFVGNLMVARHESVYGRGEKARVLIVTAVDSMEDGNPQVPQYRHLQPHLAFIVATIFVFAKLRETVGCLGLAEIIEIGGVVENHIQDKPKFPEQIRPKPFLNGLDPGIIDYGLKLVDIELFVGSKTPESPFGGECPPR